MVSEERWDADVSGAASTGILVVGWTKRQGVADAAEGLAGSLFVFDQGEADELVAVFAEADTGAYSNFGMLEQMFRELERAEMAKALGNAGPGEHGGARGFSLPAEAVETSNERVAAAAVDLGDVGDALLRAFEGADAGDLERGKGAVVEVAFDTAESGHDLGIADHEADAPAGHVVGLRQREELDGDVLRAGDLHDGGRLVTVKGDVGVGEVVHEPDTELFAQGDQSLQKWKVDALRGGIGGEVDDEELGPRSHARYGVFNLREELGGGVDGEREDVSAGDDGAVDVDGITRVGDEDGVATIEDGEAEMGDAFLRADGDDGLGGGIEIDVVARTVPVTNSFAEAGDAFGERITVGALLARGLDHLIDDVRRRGAVGIAHAEINDVFAALAGGGLELAGYVEDIGWKALEAGEVVHLLMLPSAVAEEGEPRMVRKPVVVVGSLNADLVVRAERFPQPGETLHGESFAVVTGGKGANQAAAAARLGWPTEMVGRVGTDGFGEQVRHDLEAAGAGCGAVTAVEGSTGVAVITTVGGGENTIVIAAGANNAMDVGAIDAAWPVLAGAGMVLLQLEIPFGTVVEAARRCAEAGVPVMLDPAPMQELSEELLRAVTWLTPNETEARMLCGAAMKNETAMERAAETLIRRGVQNVAFKLGGRGVYVATPHVRGLVPGFAVEVVDTTAAGDCFNGAFAVALLQGTEVREAARFAAAAAGLSTTRAGALPSMPGRNEVQSLLNKPAS